MNRVRPGRNCYVCGKDITQLALTVRAPGEDYMTAMQRQTSSGLDDRCQRARQAAAIEYERASGRVVLMQQMGAKTVERRHGPLWIAMQAVAATEAQCIALKMWPAARQATERKRK